MAGISHIKHQSRIISHNATDAISLAQNMASAQGVVTGEAETVGYRYFPGEKGTRPPIRIVYPALVAAANPDSKATPERVGWFHEHGFGFFVNGYLHVIGAKFGTPTYRIFSPIFGALASILSFASYAFGWHNLHIPKGLLSMDASPCPVKREKKYPLIVFSHGLTGSGQENLLLLSAWAKHGFVVASVHHTDGSSNRVLLETNDSSEDLFYDHGPLFTNYDADFRPKQILYRSKEMEQTINFIRDDMRMRDIANVVCDVDQVIAAGFSYGAATAILTAEMYPRFVTGLVLLDGWFYIDVTKSAGIEFEFPSQVFQCGKSYDVPSIFINSEQFAGSYPKLYQVTQKLAGMTNAKSTGNMHIIDGTKHNNFSEVVFWLPTFVLRKLGVIGSANPREAYQDVIRLSTDFLVNNF